MPETLYTARSQLSEPGRFLGDAGRALARSVPIAWPLFLGNIRVRYRRSLLGYLWLILPALATTLVCVELQSRRLVAVGSGPLPYPLHVASGIVLWQLFVEALNAPLNHLRASRQLITRSRVPHEALILAGALEVALNAAARLLVLVPVLWAFGVAPQAGMLAVPLGALALMVLGLAIGLFLAPWGLLYEDVGRALILFVGLWFFLTPIVWGGPAEGALRWNPVTPLLETARNWMAGAGAASGFWGVAGAALAGLAAAWLLYRLARPHVVARLG